MCADDGVLGHASELPPVLHEEERDGDTEDRQSPQKEGGTEGTQLGVHLAPEEGEPSPERRSRDGVDRECARCVGEISVNLGDGSQWDVTMVSMGLTR